MLRYWLRVLATEAKGEVQPYSQCALTDLIGPAFLPADAGERVGDSPYTVAVAASQPVARKSTVCGPGRMHALVAEPAEFVIEGRDRFGNRQASPRQ